MSFASPVPAWALLAGVAAMVLVAAVIYLRAGAGLSRGRAMALAALRAGSLVALFLMLLDPVRLVPLPPGGAAVAVLVDASRSMGIDDIGESRLARARALVESRLGPALAGRFDVSVFTFGGELSDRPLDEAAAVQRRSDLRGALAEVRSRYRDRRLAATVLLSDGADTGGTAGPAAGGPPVFAVPIGADDPGIDREVASIAIDEEAPVDALLDLSAVIAVRGSDAPFTVRVLENGRLVHSRRVTPSRGGPVRVTVPVAPPRAMDVVYAVDVDADAGERVTTNNRRAVIVRPAAGPRLVLLVEGAPGFEHSFLKRSLAADPSLVVDAVVRKGQDDAGDETFYVQADPARAPALARGLPADPEDLFRYDAIVLANIETGVLGAGEIERAEQFVSKRGGGLLVLGARSFAGSGLRGTPLEAALPVALSDRGDPAMAGGSRGDANQVVLTPDGLMHPIMRLASDSETTRARWEAVPSLASTAGLGRARPGAVVLATAGGAGGLGRPLVAVQRYGEGRSMIFGGEAAWRWRMLLPAGDTTYDSFWRQSLRWLASASPRALEVHAAPAAIAHEPVRLSLRVRDEAFDPSDAARVALSVEGPAGEREAPVPAPAGEPGLRAATFTPADDGIYRVTARATWPDGRVDVATTSVLVGGADVELSEPWRHDATLARLAEETGGALIDEAAIDTLPSLLQAAAGAPEVRESRLWHEPWVFALLITMLSTEWVLRRRWGLR